MTGKDGQPMTVAEEIREELAFLEALALELADTDPPASLLLVASVANIRKKLESVEVR